MDGIGSLLIIGSSILFVIPLISQLYFYYLTRIRDYLFFGSIFASASISQLLVLIDTGDFIDKVVIDLTYILVVFALLEIAVSANVDTFWLSWRGRLGLAVFVLGSMIILDYHHVNSATPDIYESMRIIVSDVYRLFVAYYILKTFDDLSLKVDTSRTQSIRFYWVSAGLLLLWLSIFRLSFYGIELFHELGIISLDLSQFAPAVSLVVNGTILGISFLSLIFAIYFPELMLVSRSNFLSTSRLYQLIEEHNKNNTSTMFDLKSPSDVIVSYLEQIPPEYFDKKDEE